MSIDIGWDELPQLYNIMNLNGWHLHLDREEVCFQDDAGNLYFQDHESTEGLVDAYYASEFYASSGQ